MRTSNPANPNNIGARPDNWTPTAAETGAYSKAQIDALFAPTPVKLKMNTDLCGFTDKSYYVKLGKFVFVAVYTTILQELSKWTDYTLATNLPEVDTTYNANIFGAPVWVQTATSDNAPLLQIDGTQLKLRPMNATVSNGDNIRTKMWYIAK
jgi:hypothetical protein